jgi:hypothetical protein
MPISNIETVARMICERDLARHATSRRQLAREVERYWHCTAAAIEGGFIDECGNRLKPFDMEAEVEAYSDWRRGNPSYVPAPHSTLAVSSVPVVRRERPRRKRPQKCDA